MTQPRFTFRRLLSVVSLFSLIVLAAAFASAQTFTTLATLNGTNGQTPYAPLVQAIDGNFYGTSYSGGVEFGNIFKVTPTGVATNVYTFCSQIDCADGANPRYGMILGSDGNLYGTTNSGGTNGWGTVFKFNVATGQRTTIYNFCSLADCADGAIPTSIMQAADGNFYGTTTAATGSNNAGTAFKLTPAGVLTTLYTFCAVTGCTDGWNPYSGIIQATNGDLYGTTYNGGDYNVGTFYTIAPGGTFTSLYDFIPGSNGSIPSGLLQVGGNFYGMTQSFGANDNGTVFKITPAGVLTTLYSFCADSGCTDGSGPSIYSSLILGTDGNLYGTTELGGSSSDGTIFKTTAAGSLTTLHSFSGSDGQTPTSALLQATDGNLYGTASGGGSGNGTVFKVTTGLGHFVKTSPVIGRVGGRVVIIGNNLTGTTAVTFNGIPATFTVVSPGAIKTTVPAGATTGTVQVTTPDGTLTSNVAFEVI